MAAWCVVPLHRTSEEAQCGSLLETDGERICSETYVCVCVFGRACV